MAAVDMCMYVGTDLQTKVQAPSADSDVICCCTVIRTCEKVGTPGTYICRTRGEAGPGQAEPGLHTNPKNYVSGRFCVLLGKFGSEIQANLAPKIR